MNGFLVGTSRRAPFSIAATQPPDTSDFYAAAVHWLPWLIGLVIVCVVASFFFVAVPKAREAANDSSNLCLASQIAYSMICYEGTHQQWPAAYSADPSGKPLLSWRVHLLPFIEEKVLYHQFHLDEPWDSPHNLQFIERRSSAYDSAGQEVPPGHTCWLAVVGPHTVIGPPFLHDKKVSFEGIRSGMIADARDETILLVEVDASASVIWTKPDDYEVDQLPLRKNFHLRSGKVVVIFANKSVRSIGESTTDEQLRAMFTRDGREGVAIPKVKSEW